MILYPELFKYPGIFIDYGCSSIRPFNEKFIVLPYGCTTSKVSTREWLKDIEDFVSKYYPDIRMNLVAYYDEQMSNFNWKNFE